MIHNHWWTAPDGTHVRIDQVAYARVTDCVLSIQFIGGNGIQMVPDSEESANAALKELTHSDFIRE